jgi:hypothetical protein
MKRVRLNDLNPTFIWYCRLGHINEQHIERLHEDGFPSSFDFESFDMCESCLFGKMTKSPFTGQSERASDLFMLMYVIQLALWSQVVFSISLLLPMTSVDMDTSA